MAKSTDFLTERKPALSALFLLVIAALAVVSALALPALAPGAAYAAGGLTDEQLSFTVDTGSYVEGREHDASNGVFPVFTLKFSENNPSLSQSTFWYAFGDSEDGVPAADSDEWTATSAADYDPASGELTLHLDTIARANYSPETNSFHKYMYFRSGTTDGLSYYVSNRAYEVNIVNCVSGDYTVDSIRASYMSGIGLSDYDLRSDNPVWAASRITVVVTNDSGTYDNARFYYQLEGYDPVPFVNKSTDNGDGTFSYYAEAVVPGEDSGILSYDGSFTIISTDLSGIYQYTQTDMRVRFDMATPEFAVTATVPSGSATAEYPVGSWTSGKVTYTLTPQTVLSGANYYYAFDLTDEFALMQRSGNSYTLSVENPGQTTVYFKAVSGSGIENLSSGYLTKIDFATPKVNISARDAAGAVIRSAGTAAGSGYRVEYASDSVTFTVTNSSSQQNGNTVSYYYSTDGVDFVPLTATNNNYTLTLSNASGAIVGETYYFRLSALSGLSDTASFTVTVLDSDYYTNMEIGETHPNAAGWLREPVKVYFTMPAVLGTADEYEIRSFVTGDASTERIENATVTDGAPAGYVRYEVTVDRILNSQSVTFNVYDKARNKVEVYMGENKTPVTDESGATIPLRTGALKLDTTVPSATVRATINGSDIELGATDWSAGEVLITITPDIPVSGINCYPMIGGNPSVTPMTMNGGSFTTIVDASGVYAFRLTSGAGVSKDYSVTVNIDSNPLEGYGFSAHTEDKNGEKIADLDLTDEGALVANDIRIVFDTNQSGHFDIYYAAYTGDAPQLDESSYVLYVHAEGENTDSILIRMPEEGSGVGTLKYSFILRSKAQNSAGEVTSLSPQYISVDYDIRDFSVTVTMPSDSDVWHGSEIEFKITPEADDSGTALAVETFQYRLSTIGGDWITIPAEDVTGGVATLVFGGIKQYVNDGEAENDGATTDAYAYMSYNGEIVFRALNSAGHASAEARVNVKVDVSTPDPRYAIAQSAGEIVFNDVNGKYVIYSNQDVRYVVPDGAIFNQKAPITYYYRDPRTDGSEEIGDITEWTQLGGNGIALESGKDYWIYAVNSAGKGSALYKVIVQKETSAPTATVTGGTEGAGGVLEFNWTDNAVVQIRAISSTPVYFWYSLDGGAEWIKISETATPVSGSAVNKSITFSATEGADEFTIPGNRLDTVIFKITNLSGSEYVIPKSVIVRIDSASPSFTVDFTTPSSGVIASSAADDGLAGLEYWYPEAITATVTPLSYNPGGVIYTYSLSEAGPYENMRTNMFSTDDIVGFAGNGEVTIWIRAVANANLLSVVQSYTLRVDKVKPEFELTGQANKDGVSKGKLTSGTWTNADEVVISRSTSVENKSGVTYTYYLSDNPGQSTVWAAGQTIAVTKLATLYVSAISGAGLRVDKTFEVKIDNVAPIINAGNIVNKVDAVNIYDAYKYYIDQVVTYTEDNLKSAMYNNFPLSNGQIIATNTVDNSNGGFVHIVVEDMAGNKAELIFYMTIFELTVNNIELSDEHRKLLDRLESDFEAAQSTLTSSRQQYFATLISRLNDRLVMLEKQVEDYQGYLRRINEQTSFELQSDYETMYTYINYFISEDDLIRYPEWQQEKIKEGIYESYYNKLLSEYYKLDALMADVRSVQNSVIALPATNVVEKTDYQSVIRVYNAYDSLSRDQKTVFKSNLYNKLIELKRICEVLLLQDESTGISIDGDKLVGETTGVMLEVVSYSPESELFIQAQTTLYNMLTANDPRKILSINRLALTGFGSQYDTGEVTITLPIPEDYQNYVYFAVYRLSADGTITPVSGVRRTPDGADVYFTSMQLDTYVLATSANVVVREDPAKIYGSIAGIEIDGTLLTYITYSVVGMFVIFVVIIILVALRRRKFLQSYNRDHKKALARRGITRIPKGNPPPPSNPARPEERVSHEHNVYYKK